MARQAVNWFVDNVEAIPPLDRGNRKNHGVHLRMIADITGSLPPVSSAGQAYAQYKAVFNAFESKAASSPNAFRMYLDDDPPATTSTDACNYLVQQYGFYILVFAPNGAIESFRRKTPETVAIDGQNKTDFDKRVAFSMRPKRMLRGFTR